MKRTLFWVMFIPLGVLMILLDCLWLISEKYDTFLEQFEEWCFKKR